MCTYMLIQQFNFTQRSEVSRNLFVKENFIRQNILTWKLLIGNEQLKFTEDEENRKKKLMKKEQKEKRKQK